MCQNEDPHQQQGKNTAAAWDFIQWAVQPAQQIAIFKNIGNLPSQPALYADPAIVDFKNPFFSDAPVGKIFSDTAKNLTPQYLGKKSGPVRVSVENVLRKAWNEAVKEAQKAATA